MSDTRTPGEPVRSTSADLSEAAQRASEQGHFAGAKAAEQARETAGQLRRRSVRRAPLTNQILDSLSYRCAAA
jgi:hypothetical protein